GNLGAVAAVCELLVQSHDGIELLPALPPQWPAGGVSGLRLRGGFEIDVDWRDGGLERAELRSGVGGPCRVRTAASIAVECAGEPVPVEHVGGETLFETQ